jgi:3-oxoacyl-[acyl-carrier-protein] synthase-1
MTYIEGYALRSSLGESAETSVKNLRTQSANLVTLACGNRYYKIPNLTPLEYYDTIERVVKDAFTHANLSPEEIKASAIFIGTSSAKLPLNETYLKEDGEPLKDLYMDEMTEVIANRMGIEGFKTIISTACTSSSNALIQAKEMIESGLIERAIVVGVELYNALSIKGFESFMLLTEDKIKPFDSNRDGLILGEALSAIVLSKKASNFALVGTAIKVDTTSITSPTSDNLATVMQEALQNANITPQAIDCIKTHSTATRQNDEAEAKGIHTLFGDTLPKIVTLKPYIGHTMGACGTNELVLFIESINQGFIPKSIHFETMDTECNIQPNLQELTPTNGYHLLNYFGFGGNNSSLVLKYSGA